MNTNIHVQHTPVKLLSSVCFSFLVFLLLQCLLPPIAVLDFKLALSIDGCEDMKQPSLEGLAVESFISLERVCWLSEGDVRKAFRLPGGSI